MIDRRILMLAIRLQGQYLSHYADYLDECAEYLRKGYRPHYCEHGTNRWTDYDNICGYCEEGQTMADPQQRRARALDDAKCRFAEAPFRACSRCNGPREFDEVDYYLPFCPTCAPIYLASDY
jgi:hypothetical protein